MASLQDEPYVIDSLRRDDSEAESERDNSDEDVDDDDEFNLGKRFEEIIDSIANGEHKLSKDNELEEFGSQLVCFPY